MALQTINTAATAGNVKFVVKNGDKVVETFSVHNNGTVKLCEYIRDALMGSYVIGKMPGYVIPCVADSSDNLIEMFSYGVPYTSTEESPSVVETDESYAIANFKFVIPSTLLTGRTAIDGVNLYSFDTSKTLYATVNLKKENKQIPIIEGTNLELIWTIKIAC